MRNDIAADHAIVEAVADDDRALRERLAALEAEVQADADAQRARKAAAVAKLRDQRVTQTAGGAVVRNRAAPGDDAAARRRSRLADRDAERDAEDDRGRSAEALEDLGGALELASKANKVKQELARKPRKGEKNWMISGGASLLGPIGWLYAGSLREAVPATAAWLLVASVVWKILPFLWMPLMMVVMPLSGIAGVVYALSYNRAGKRQRLFSDKKAKALPPSARAHGKAPRLEDGS
jgi:Flp pilus assembly protein TadB